MLLPIAEIRDEVLGISRAESLPLSASKHVHLGIASKLILVAVRLGLVTVAAAVDVVQFVGAAFAWSNLFLTSATSRRAPTSSIRFAMTA